MEQAQFGVLEMDLFIASLQPMRWIKVPGGRSRARRGRTLGGAVSHLPPQPPVASALQNNRVNYSQDVIFWTTSEV
jgi:hypothetical protein